MVAAAAILMALVVATAWAYARARPRPPTTGSGRLVYGGALSLDTRTGPAGPDVPRQADVVSERVWYLVDRTLVGDAAASAAIVPALATARSHNATGTAGPFGPCGGVRF